MTSRAATYARISREDEGRILENQVGALREYCAARGLDIVREYVDVASGAIDNRPGFNDLLRDATRARGRPFDVVVSSLSRMTRGGIEAALHVLRTLERARVGWRFVEQPVLDNDATTSPLAREILLSVLAALDADYRRRISVATKAAYNRRKQAASAIGTKVRWGRPRKRVVLSPAETGVTSGMGAIP